MVKNSIQFNTGQKYNRKTKPKMRILTLGVPWICTLMYQILMHSKIQVGPQTLAKTVYPSLQAQWDHP